MKLKELKIVIIFLFLFLFPFSVLAANPLGVVINEIAWMGTEKSYSDEWIELFNTTNKEIDISGWQIENAKSKNETLTILAAKIPTKGYFLICRKEIGDCDLIESGLSLHNEYNENGKLVLKDTAGNIIDTTPEANHKQWPAGDNGTKQTMERKDTLVSGSDSSNWQTSQNAGGTAKAENSLVSLQTPEEIAPELEPELPEPQQKTEPMVYPSDIFINEILPSPKGADAENEWLEIFNGNNFEVNVSGWQIRDTVGATKTFTIPEGIKIAPGEFLVFSRPETKITLQNKGDSLEILNPNGEIINKVNYQKAPLGQSFNRTSSGWVWSITLTPGETNVVSVSEVPGTGPPEDLKEKEGETKPPLTYGQLEEDEKVLAKIGEQLPKSPNPLVVFLVALAIAVFSAVVVLFLKKRIETEEQ